MLHLYVKENDWGSQNLKSMQNVRMLLTQDPNLNKPLSPYLYTRTYKEKDRAVIMRKWFI